MATGPARLHEVRAGPVASPPKGTWPKPCRSDSKGMAEKD